MFLLCSYSGRVCACALYRLRRSVSPLLWSNFRSAKHVIGGVHSISRALLMTHLFMLCAFISGNCDAYLITAFIGMPSHTTPLVGHVRGSHIRSAKHHWRCTFNLMCVVFDKLFYTRGHVYALSCRCASVWCDNVSCRSTFLPFTPCTVHNVRVLVRMNPHWSVTSTHTYLCIKSATARCRCSLPVASFCFSFVVV